MIIYNVTLSIHPELEAEVLEWLKSEHIPEVMDTGLFIDSQMFKVMEKPEARTHNSFAIQYRLENWQKFHDYQQKHAAELRQKTIDRYGENVLAFRTFLEKIG